MLPMLFQNKDRAVRQEHAILLRFAAPRRGLSTAAWMDSLAVRAETWDGVTVVALVTPGIDENACRAGDPASWYEKDGAPVRKPGTFALQRRNACLRG